MFPTFRFGWHVCSLRLSGANGHPLQGAGCDEEEDGDRRYLAPEVLDDGADMQAADMYSLGASALELALATRLPEAGPEYAALRTSCPRPPAGLPPQVGALISALMDPDPRRRPTAEQVLQDPCLLSLVSAALPQK